MVKYIGVAFFQSGGSSITQNMQGMPLLCQYFSQFSGHDSTTPKGRITDYSNIHKKFLLGESQLYVGRAQKRIEDKAQPNSVPKYHFLR